MTTKFDKKNFMNDAHFLCVTDLVISFSKNSNRTTTFIASSSNIQYALNSISTIFDLKFRSFQKTTRFGWQRFLTKRISWMMLKLFVRQTWPFLFQKTATERQLLLFHPRIYSVCKIQYTTIWSQSCWIFKSDKV